MELWWWSEDHDPTHFHASRPDQWEIVVNFMECTSSFFSYRLKWGSEPSGRDGKVLLGLVLANRAKLLDEWDNKVVQR